jgi:peptidoglycan/LPS O-acetylase OafA/YrhL
VAPEGAVASGARVPPAGAEENEVYLPREPLLGVAATLYFALGIGTGCTMALTGSLSGLSRQQQWAAFIGIVAAFSLYLVHVPLLLTTWHLLQRHASAWLIALAGVALSYPWHRSPAA